MEITDVKVRKLFEEGPMKAVVSVTFDNAIVVHDIKIIDGQNGLFIAMPSRKTPDGEFKDIVHPLNTETREMIKESSIPEDMILLIREAYNQLCQSAMIRCYHYY